MAGAVVALLLAEALLRLMGYSPDKGLNIPSFDCAKKQVVNDDYLGFKFLPGKYNCSINGLEFYSTIDDDSFRITATESHKEDSLKMHLFGCSITFGHALDDTATMAWKLQHLLPHVEVKNYGIGAGSTVQSYLVLKRNYAKGLRPQVVVVNYSSFHDQRNAMTRPWRKMWTTLLVDKRDSKDNKHVQLPYAICDDDSTWQLRYITAADFKPGIPFTRFSALCNILNEALEKGADKGKNETEASFRVLLSISQLCNENGARLIVTGITGDEATKTMLRKLNKEGILTVDISVDLKDRSFNLQPYDNHPNGKANSAYAERLFSYLNNSGGFAERNQ